MVSMFAKISNRDTAKPLNRDTIAVMAAAAMQNTFANTTRLRRARELEVRKANYAHAERHAQPLLDALSTVKQLSNGRVDFEVLSNSNDELDASDPFSIDDAVRINLIGLGRFSFDPGSAVRPDDPPCSFRVTANGMIVFCRDTCTSVEDAIGRVLRLAAEKHLLPPGVAFAARSSQKPDAVTARQARPA